MKVLMINASPHEKGCTYTALSEIADTLEKEGIESEIINIGKAMKHPCVACMTCAKTKSGKCVFDDDPVNECIEKIKEADGFIIGEPVYYGGPHRRRCLWTEYFTAQEVLSHSSRLPLLQAAEGEDLLRQWIE